MLLVGAGATVDREWLDNTEEGQKVRADASMLAALSGRTPQFEKCVERKLKKFS